MTDSRQQFEAWAAKEQPQLYLQYLPRVGCYSNSDAELAWQCWQASRADCVVELPVAFDASREDASYYLFAYKQSDIEEVLTAAGVTYK